MQHNEFGRLVTTVTEGDVDTDNINFPCAHLNPFIYEILFSWSSAVEDFSNLKCSPVQHTELLGKNHRLKPTQAFTGKSH